MNPQPGELIQIKRGVHGMGQTGIVIGLSDGGCLAVLFHNGVRRVHPSNLQVPDGRTRPRL